MGLQINSSPFRPSPLSTSLPSSALRLEYGILRLQQLPRRFKPYLPTELTRQDAADSLAGGTALQQSKAPRLTEVYRLTVPVGALQDMETHGRRV